MKNLTPRKKALFCATLVSFGIIWHRTFATEINVSKHYHQLDESPHNEKEQKLKEKDPILQHAECCRTILNERLAYCNNAPPFSSADKSPCRLEAFVTYHQCMGN